MATKTRREAATIQLTQDEDSDLIRWLAGIPKGGRNQRIKDALRAGLKMPIRRTDEQTDGESRSGEIEELKMQIAQMQRQLAELPRLIAANAHLSATVDQGDRIDQEIMQKREQRHRKAKW
jgi:hypothetical protein